MFKAGDETEAIGRAGKWAALGSGLRNELGPELGPDSAREAAAAHDESSGSTSAAWSRRFCRRHSQACTRKAMIKRTTLNDIQVWKSIGFEQESVGTACDLPGSVGETLNGARMRSTMSTMPCIRFATGTTHEMCLFAKASTPPRCSSSGSGGAGGGGGLGHMVPTSREQKGEKGGKEVKGVRMSVS